MPDVQVSLTASTETRELPAACRSVPLYQMAGPRQSSAGAVARRCGAPSRLIWRMASVTAGCDGSSGWLRMRVGAMLARFGGRGRGGRAGRDRTPADCRCRASSASSPTRSMCAPARPRTTTSPGSTPAPPAGRGHRRIRELAPHPRLGRRRGLGLSLAAVRPAHRAGLAAEGQGRAGRVARQAGQRERRHRQAAARRARQREALPGRLVPHRRRRASTAGSSRSACGASIRTRRSNRRRQANAPHEREAIERTAH